MPLILSTRDTQSRERMDNPRCDQSRLFRTYAQFSRINALLSGWKQIYRTRIRPLISGMDRPARLLDIGFGGGDIPIRMAHWARRDNLPLQITAIETDERAMRYVHGIEAPPNVTFEHCASGELLARGARFDIVISNHLLHHLGEEAFRRLLDEARRLSTRRVIFNDLERSDLGYLLFNVFSRPLFRHSFITHDGLLSIRRSYTLGELQAVVPPGWNAERLFPFRLLLTYNHTPARTDG